MPWALVDDGFPENLKSVRLRLKGIDGLAAAGLWTYCLCWAHFHTRDKHPSQQGLVPEVIVCTYAGEHAARLAGMLVEVGLWDSVSDGWMIHDFRAWQQLHLREQAIEAGRRGGMRSGAVRRAKTRAGFEVQGMSQLPLDDLSEAPLEAPLEGTLEGTIPKGTEAPTPPHPNKKDFLDTCRPASISDSDDFKLFYDAYPRHIGRKAAEKAWAKAVTEAEPSVIIEAAGRYADKRRYEDPRFTKHPATWLNQGCWTDEDDPSPVTEADSQQW